MPYPQPPWYAPHGMVATSQPLAAAAGLAVLRRGGNAVDAALAAATTLTVVQPPSNDIGGDLFAIVWDGHRLHGLNASGRSPAGLSREVVLAATGGRGAVPTTTLGGAQARGPAMPARGWLPVTVPGAPAGWRDLHDRFGSLPFADLFTDAIGYAEHGYPVSAPVAAGWSRAHRTYLEVTDPGGGVDSGPPVGPAGGPVYGEWARVFTVDGVRPPRAGEHWQNPAAARTLRRIAETGAAAFYRDEIAEAMVGHAARTGGLLSAADLADHESQWVTPIRADYRGHEVWELPPNGQGIAALLALNILDGMELSALAPAGKLHRLIEAVKLGFADAHAYVADPGQVTVPAAALLDPAYAASRRALIGERAADPAPGTPTRGGTVYLCAADRAGMMVSLIQSTYFGFGSFVTVPGCGFVLQNRGAGFSLDPAHPNAVAPNKRPYHTIIPGFLTRDGAPVGPFGVMGGHMQPQGHVQLISATLDEGQDPQTALAAPRWYWHTGRTVLVEPDLAAGPVAELRRRGHDVVVADSADPFGCGQAIWRLPGGGYVAGSDPRAGGCAAGY